MRNITKPKVSLGSFILGLVVAIMVFHAYVVYNMRTAVNASLTQTQINARDIAQVANVLNQALNPQQGEAQAQETPQEVSQEGQDN